MIEELKLVQEIVGDLSGVGLWVFAGVLLLKLVNVAAIIYMVKFVVEKTYLLFKCPITKKEAERLQSENEGLQGSIKEVKLNAKMEVEEIKHLYKILKESKSE